MFNEFNYRPKFGSLFFNEPCMKFEGDPGGDPDPAGGGGGGDPDPAPVALVDHEGKFTEKWLEHFDEGDRPTLERFKETGLKSLGKAHVELQRQFRSPDDYVKMPKEDSSDEEKAAFHKRRGVPNEAKDYPKYEIPAELANVNINDEEMAYYNDLAKKANLTPAQLKIMADGHYANLNKVFADADAAAQEVNHQAFDKADMELNKRFGRAKEQKILQANAFMRYYGGEEAVVLFKAENNPHFTMFIDSVAKDMAPARLAGIMGSAGVAVPTNDAINAKMTELRNQPGYYDRSHPDHKKLMEQRNALTLQRTA